MGKLIMCNGSRTNRPYGFASAGVRIYSIEELCYFLYHHVYLIEDVMFNDTLFDWIGTELKLSERAEKLKLLKQQKADLKTLVAAVLCSSDYFEENEIKELLHMLDSIIGMPPYKRNIVKASNFLKNQQYTEAEEELERILGSEETVGLEPEEYGDVLHNLAVTKLHTTGFKEAAELFRQAYERNHRNESLRQYLYALKLCNNDIVFNEKIGEYQISEDLRNEIQTFLELKDREAEHIEAMKHIERMKQLKVDGKLGEYYKLADQMIDSWKREVRR